MAAILSQPQCVEKDPYGGASFKRGVVQSYGVFIYYVY